MTNTNTNVSLIALGLAEVREGTEITAGGVVRMAEGIIQSWRSPIRWSYGSGDNEVSNVSTIADMFKPVRNEKGETDSKFLPAMYRAVAYSFLVGDDEFTNSDKMQFKRAWQIAAAKMAGVAVEFVDADILRNGKRAKVRAVEVPASVAFDLYDTDGTTPTAAGKVLEADVKRSLKRAKRKADDDAVRSMAEETPIECVGGKIDGLAVPSVSVISDRLAAYAIDAGLMPSKGSRNKSASADKFRASLTFVSKCLDEVLSDSDEAGFAPCPDAETEMRGLAEKLAAYFAA
jgi:hypothetical protein